MYTVIREPVDRPVVEGVRQSAEIIVIVDGAEQVPVEAKASWETEVRDPLLSVAVPSLNTEAFT